VETLATKPASLSWSEAAGLPLAGLAAHRAIVDVLAVQRGEHVLIHGASGGVGSLAAQLALHRGAIVYGTGSPSSHDYLRSLGIAPFARGSDVARSLLSSAPAGLDAALDCVGRNALQTAHEAMRPEARIASIAGQEDGVPMVYARMDPNALNKLARLAGRGALCIRVAATYPLEKAAEAQRMLAGPHAPGKIVLEMA
jgi:NADPH:quinone reductase-like Zn-dependent oxidoreductase